MSAPALPSVSAPSDSVSQWKRYPAYKESGADWLGEVPEHWEVGPLKRFASFVSRGNSPEYVDDSSIQVINQACIYWNGLRLANVKFQRETDISAWKGRLAVGDLLINSTGTGTLGRASIFDRQGTFIADGHVTVVRLNTGELSTQYLLYLVQTPIYQGYIYAAIISGSTNQIELSRDGLRATPIMVPPIMEQQVIAAFLGRETARIDQLIAKKERQIELLQEKRAAIISHTVTKGLDASVPMKGSGADWLGKIPSHWEVKRLKYTVTECSNGTWGAEPVGDDSDLVCVRVADFDRARGRINPTNLTMRSISQRDIQEKLLSRGDLLLEKSGGGDLQPVGAVVLFELDIPAVCSNFIARMPAAEGYNPSFMCYLHYTLYSMRINVRSINSSFR